MANAWYYSAAEELLKGNLDLSSADIRALLIDTGDYTVSLSTHAFLDDIAGSGRVGSPVALTGISVTDGVLDADDVTFTGITGDSIEAVVLYIYNVSESAAQLLMYIDTGTGLGITPDGRDIILNWDNGSNKIYKV